MSNGYYEVSEEEYLRLWLQEVLNGSDETFEEFKAYTRITTLRTNAHICDLSRV